ncbi:hypothetical protein M758_UG212500 [Ceratodon purpureus]|nr:hypothetical protein M758_UG212500 [Ceratodon purpureus]
MRLPFNNHLLGNLKPAKCALGRLKCFIVEHCGVHDLDKLNLSSECPADELYCNNILMSSDISDYVCLGKNIFSILIYDHSLFLISDVHDSVSNVRFDFISDLITYL